MSEKPGRYQRSTGGLVGALIVTLVCVFAFVGWRELFRGDMESEVLPIEWQESVKLADSEGLPIVRPAELPEGWRATSVHLRGVGGVQWGLGLLTDDGAFVGIRQQDVSVSELVQTYVDKAAVQGDDVTVSSRVTDTWQTWSDDGGDRGYSTELGDDALLVYGSAPAADLEELIGLLEPAPAPTPAD